MAFSLADFVAETTLTTGTGSYALAGAVDGFRAFQGQIGNGSRVPYVARAGTGWEVGIGTFTAPATLARTTILASSNSGAAVNWGAGTKQVNVGLPAVFAALLFSEQTGFLAQTGEQALARRSLAVTAGHPFSWTNPAGAAGNPTLGFTSVLAALQFLGLIGNGTASRDLTGGYTLQPADRGVVQRLTTAAGAPLQLPASATAGAGWPAVLWNLTGATATIARDGSDKIAGAASGLTLASGALCILIADGVDDWVPIVFMPGFGSAGQMLTAGGAGAFPAWAAFSIAAYAASASEQEAGSELSKFVAPGTQHRHPSAAKAWVGFDASSGAPVVKRSYNLETVTPITDLGQGWFRVNLGTDMSDGNYAAVVTVGPGGLNAPSLVNGGAKISGGQIDRQAPAAGSYEIVVFNHGYTGYVDNALIDAVFFGDQA